MIPGLNDDLAGTMVGRKQARIFEKTEQSPDIEFIVLELPV